MLEVLRSGQLSLGPACCRAFEEALRRARRRAHASAVSSGTAGLHLALRAVGVAAATRSSRRRSRSSPRPTRSSSSARGRCSPTSTRVTLNLDPERRPRRSSERTKALLPVHIFGYPADVPALERLGPADRRGRLRGARRRPRRRHARGRARPPGGVRLLRQQAADDRRGRHGRHLGDAALKERIDSERNQGRAPDMGWLDHDRLGFNYRLSDVACALGVAQLERLDEHARRPRAGGRAGTARRWRASRASTLPCEDAAAPSARLVRLRRPAAARPRPRRDHRRAARARRADASPTCPRIHLMSLLPRALRPPRGRVPGVRGRRRALARAAVLPGDDRGPGRAGRRGRCALDASTGQRLARLPMSRFSEPQDAAFHALNASSAVRPAAVAPRRRAIARARARCSRPQGDHRRGRPRRAARAGSTRSRSELDDGTFAFAPDDEDIHMAVERRLTELAGPGRRQAAHRPLAQRPGRDRHRAVHARARAGAPATRPAAAHARRWSTPPSATSTGRCPATRTCSARSRSTSPTTCSRTSGCSSATARASPPSSRRPRRCRSARARSPGVNFDTDRGDGRARARLRRASPPNSIDAVSNRDFVLDYLARGGDLRDAPVAARRRDRAVVERGVRLLRARPTRGRRARRSCRRRRTPTPPSCCARRRRAIVGHLAALHGVMHGAAADLQQGPAGGQGAPVRRRRHARRCASPPRAG